MSASRIGKKRTPHSAATKLKISESNRKASKNRDYSFSQSPEYRANQAAKMRAVWEERKRIKMEG